MEERRYDREEVNKLLVDKPEVEFHAFDNNHYTIRPISKPTPYGLNRKQRRTRERAKKRK
jgi:hypothetical protein